MEKPLIRKVKEPRLTLTLMFRISYPGEWVSGTGPDLQEQDLHFKQDPHRMCLHVGTSEAGSQDHVHQGMILKHPGHHWKSKFSSSSPEELRLVLCG